ncbi:VOC family protein [Streptomyces lydicus]|uniref:VOC family protein n=1 Tax=Streptomyces lydicus TaxID=47763 RepID=UPI0037917D40
MGRCLPEAPAGPGRHQVRDEGRHRREERGASRRTARRPGGPARGRGEEFEIRPEPGRLPGLEFVRLDESKKAKSRLHLDFRPDDQDARWLVWWPMAHSVLISAQGDQSWVVLADPEGNEFCVLGRRRQ